VGARAAGAVVSAVVEEPPAGRGAVGGDVVGAAGAEPSAERGAVGPGNVVGAAGAEPSAERGAVWGDAVRGDGAAGAEPAAGGRGVDASESGVRAEAAASVGERRPTSECSLNDSFWIPVEEPESTRLTMDGLREHGEPPRK
jgi:hypothetical protein